MGGVVDVRRPYYSDDRVTLYHGDCRDVLPSLIPDSIDLLITDPPYGVRWQSNNRALPFAEIVGDDSTSAGIGGLALSVPLLKNHRHAYIFGRWDFSTLPFSDSTELIWDKGQIGLGDLAQPWGPQHEYIQFLVLVRSEKNRRQNYGDLSARMRQGSILRVPRRNAAAVVDHPTEKPVELLRRFVESSSLFDELVLDPFAGIGSTLVAAKLEGRRAIGIEIDERYCEIAAQRLTQGTLVGLLT